MQARTETQKEVVIDATFSILGRLASIVAKRLLDGEKISVVNVEKTIILGDPQMIINKYLERISRGSPHHGPFFPRAPDRIFWRTVRGMLPYKKKKGKDALRRLKVYIGVPEKFKNEKCEKLAQKHVKTKFITLEKLSKRIGWNP